MGCSLESLEVFFSNIGEPKFRAKQLLSWVHQKGIIDFNLMTDFNKGLRSKLESLAIVKPPKIHKKYSSGEGTQKFLIKLDSGSMVEMVIIPEKNRRTLCVSSQEGCALQCTFCATGAQGFDQNASATHHRRGGMSPYRAAAMRAGTRPPSWLRPPWTRQARCRRSTLRIWSQIVQR